MERDRTYVIGGGLAGLTAAASLARAGHCVTVLEAAEHLGGRARSRQRDGFSLNLGPHALYRDGGGRAVLRSLGVRVRGGRPRVERSGLLVDGELVSTASYLRRLDDRVRLLTAFAGFGRRRAATWEGRSAQAWIDDVTDDPRGRALLASVVRTGTYTADTELLDAGAAGAQLRAAARGVIYVDGGWSSLVGDLADVVRAHGGSIETSCRVERIEHEGTVDAVRVAGGRAMPAAAVVIAGLDPARVAGLLDGDAAGRLHAAADAAVPVRMAHLDLALRPLPSARFANLLGIDDNVYVTVPSDVAACAPSDAAVVQIGRYLRPGEEGLDHRPALEAALDLHQPDWRDHVVDARFVPRSLVSADHARVATRGSAERPGPDVAGVRGLAVAGDWVGPTGMLADAAIISGAAAAAAVAADMLERVTRTPVPT